MLSLPPSLRLIHHTRTRGALAVAILSSLALAPVLQAGASSPKASKSGDSALLKSWIEEFKTSPKGPFENIRWFCNDGTVLPPKAYACRPHGGGIQHGALNSRAKQLRSRGYAVANVLADLDGDQFSGDDADLETLKQILLERFLISWNDGWILRGARTYRGAVQVEDEEAGAQRITDGILADPAWREPARFFLLRETLRLLPLQADEQSASAVRQLALQIAADDKAFTPLRAKIHNVPDAGDAQRVREYSRTQGVQALASRYAKLAADIDALYSSAGSAEAVASLAGKTRDSALQNALADAAPGLGEASGSAERLAAASHLLSALRDAFPRLGDPAVAQEAIQLSLSLESTAFTAATDVLAKLNSFTRQQRLALLVDSSQALYGAGFLSGRHVAGVRQSVQRLTAQGDARLSDYRHELRYLARVSEWAGQWHAFHFGLTVESWMQIEPEAHLFPQDRLRSSPLLFYTAVIDSLVLDANRLAGIEHEIFGRKVGAGLRALNPGLTRGVIRRVGDGSVQSDGIYLLPATTSDLPRVSGILTQGEGSSLSHVQLLARNLGIPNVVIGDEHLAAVTAHLGKRAVLAVSPGGIVQLDIWRPKWEAVFGDQASGDGATSGLVIRPDLNKLDLENTSMLSLSELRATDSGRLSGPKGANLGELKHFFGDKVPNGFVIPFGIFRKLLDQPLEAASSGGIGGPSGSSELSVWHWMKQSYDEIAAEADPAKQSKRVAKFLARLRSWILAVDPGEDFRNNLRERLRQNFGADGSYGVFVRSDTNVEDLPGFTGAGLNLTVANVVGYDNILASIHDVWASPFDERSYGWRQTHMQDPEYVFPAVVIQLGYPAEKSGVMVTTDIDRSEPGWMSVAISEGVGGAVDGQATESLRLNLATQEIDFLSQATAPNKAVLNPRGGVSRVPASGTDRVLNPKEAEQLVAVAKQINAGFESLLDEEGNAMPADIEFAFRDGELALLQIRPFVESSSALSNAYLIELDGNTASSGNAFVPLDSIPRVTRREKR